MKQEQFERIIEIISEEFDITTEMLLSIKRTEDIVRARHTLYKTLNRLGLNKVATGRALGKDHTTVMNGLKVYRNLYDTDDNFRYRAKKAEDRINHYIYEQTKE
jgi:chromosomal replication initiation ATPase DnaA